MDQAEHLGHISTETLTRGLGCKDLCDPLGCIPGLEGALAAGDAWSVPQAKAGDQFQEASGRRSRRESVYFLEQADSSLEHSSSGQTEGQTCAVCRNSWGPSVGPEPSKPQAVPRGLVRSCNLPWDITRGQRPLSLVGRGKGRWLHEQPGWTQLPRSQENHGRGTRHTALHLGWRPRPMSPVSLLLPFRTSSSSQTPGANTLKCHEVSLHPAGLTVRGRREGRSPWLGARRGQGQARRRHEGDTQGQ